VHVLKSHGHPCSRAHCNASRCPPKAAYADVLTDHAHPFALAQASRAADPTKCWSLSGTPPFSPARGSSVQKGLADSDHHVVGCDVTQ